MRLFALIALIGLAAAGCSRAEEQEQPPPDPVMEMADEPEQPPERVELGDGLAIEILSPGTGEATVESGSRPRLDTHLSDPEGNSIWSGEFQFRVGSGEAIIGFDRGVRGMKLDERRRIHVPWQLGYGERGNAGIPPRQDLVFEVTLKSLE